MWIFGVLGGAQGSRRKSFGPVIHLTDSETFWRGLRRKVEGEKKVPFCN